MWCWGEREGDRDRQRERERERKRYSEKEGDKKQIETGRQKRENANTLAKFVQIKFLSSSLSEERQI